MRYCSTTFSRHNRRKAQRGFTLIELIIALAMVAVLSLSLYESLRVGFQAQKSAETALEPIRTATMTMDMIRTDLENAMQPNVALTNTDYVLAGSFEGTQSTDSIGQEADDVIFFGTYDSPEHYDANGEIKQVEFKVVQPINGNDNVLVRRVTRNLTTQTPPNPDEEILCRGVYSFTLQYFDGANWNPTWDSTQEDNNLPAAVQITLQLKRPTTANPSALVTYTRIIPLSCSMAALDPTVNSGAGATVQ